MSDWISVKDRLPSGKDIILVFCPDDHVRPIHLVFWGNWENLDGSHDEEGFTHWMSVPAMPEDILRLPIPKTPDSN